MSDVTYGEIAVEQFMPEGGRRSPLHEFVEDIGRNPEKHKSARCVASYDDKTKANSDAVMLRNKYGRKIEDRGYNFAVRKVTLPNPETGELEERHGLWIYHDPGQIVAGEWEKHEAKMKEQARKANAKAAEKKAKEKKAKTAKAG